MAGHSCKNCGPFYAIYVSVFFSKVAMFFHALQVASLWDQVAKPSSLALELPVPWKVYCHLH